MTISPASRGDPPEGLVQPEALEGWPLDPPRIAPLKLDGSYQWPMRHWWLALGAASSIDLSGSTGLNVSLRCLKHSFADAWHRDLVAVGTDFSFAFAAIEVKNPNQGTLFDPDDVSPAQS